MEQALALGNLVEHRNATQAILLEALARRADGVILVNYTGLVTFTNDVATAIIAADDGFTLRDHEFVTRRGPETRRLHTLICNATAASLSSAVDPGGQMLVTRPSGKRPYVVRVMPAPPTERFLSGESIACVITIHDLSAVQTPPKQLLCSAFGLTEREADLIGAIIQCQNLAAASAHAGMSVNTARNHLASIFRKCGIASQMEAAQLFSRLL